MFRSARLKLSVLYVAVLAIVMAGFSIALYIAIATSTTKNLEVSETIPAAVESVLLNAQLARIRWALLGINLAGWAVAAVTAYLVAGRTLAPIEEALARQRQFTSHASHELRTPLTVIKGEIDVTRARERSPAEYVSTLGTIDAEVAHLQSITDDLLNLARIESGSGVVEGSTEDLPFVVRSVLAQCDAELRERGNSVSVELLPGLHVPCGPSQLQQVMANLVDNAVRYSPPRSSIRITANRSGKFVNISVHNSGSFIDSSELPHIFTPFYRAKGSEAGAGTGLGLAICDSIVRAHGGSINAYNTDSGVAFVLRLRDD